MKATARQQRTCAGAAPGSMMRSARAKGTPSPLGLSSGTARWPSASSSSGAPSMRTNTPASCVRGSAAAAARGGLGRKGDEGGGSALFLKVGATARCRPPRRLSPAAGACVCRCMQARRVQAAARLAQRPQRGCPAEGTASRARRTVRGACVAARDGPLRPAQPGSARPAQSCHHLPAAWRVRGRGGAWGAVSERATATRAQGS